MPKILQDCINRVVKIVFVIRRKSYANKKLYVTKVMCKTIINKNIV